MNLNEIIDLIHIRRYLNETMGYHMFSKNTVSELNKILNQTDKKIVELLKSEDFKKHIETNDLNKEVIENIKSSLR